MRRFTINRLLIALLVINCMKFCMDIVEPKDETDWSEPTKGTYGSINADTVETSNETLEEKIWRYDNKD